MERNLGENSPYSSLISLFYRVLSQKKNSKDKVYSLHEPDVLCISKGKEHKKYEFGNKVSIITSIRGVILGALSFRNEYDGHTIDSSLEQVRRMTGKTPELLAGDRGYRGQKQSGDTIIEIPGTPKARDTRYQKQKKRRLFCKRAGIEPKIGHLKSDHRLGRNFYKGLQGDAINIMLAAAAFNFKRAMGGFYAYFLKSVIRSLENISQRNMLFKERLLNNIRTIPIVAVYLVLRLFCVLKKSPSVRIACR